MNRYRVRRHELPDCFRTDYDLKCPSAGQWRLRAQSYCRHEEMYTCLKFIDPDMPYEQKYTEACKGPRKEVPGEKPVINSGNFDNVDCSEDRYQPILFSTTKGSNCLYLKSNCNEEGQFIYSNGSTTQDRTCGCNYVEQYVFLSQNISHPCYCRPSVEDCTCYKKACDSGFRLSPDYKCVPENETSGRYNCKEIVTLEKDKVVNLTKAGFEEEKLEGRNRDPAFIYTVLLLVLVLFGVLWMVLFLKRIQIYDRYILCTTKVFFTSPLSDINDIDGEDVVLSCVVCRDELPLKWFRGDTEIIADSDPRYKISSVGTRHELTITEAQCGDSDNYSVQFKEFKNRKCSAIVIIQDYYTKNPKHVSCIEGDAVSLDCEVVFSGMAAQWYKDGYNIESTSRRYTTIEQKRHMLIIPCVEMNDGGRYEIDIQDRRRSAELRIESYFTKTFDEIKCAEGGTVNFVCEVIEENTTANWFLNDREIKSSHGIKFETSGRQHKLTIVNARASDSGDYSVIVKNSKRKATLHVGDDKIKRAAYLDDIQKKTEKRLYIRVMIVGEHGVGKSCLLRRLLEEGIEGVESTDGIDIVVRRCKIRLSDGKWIFDADQDPKRQYAIRIKRAIQQENVEYEVKMDMTTISLQTFPGPIEHSTHDVKTNNQQGEVQIAKTAENKPSGHQAETFASEQKTHKTRERKKPRQPTGSLTSTRKVTKVLTHEVEQELEHFLSRIDKYEKENEAYVEIGFWDFAGEKDYYGTHYTFLDPHALYLLVTDCSVELKQTETCVTYDSIGEYVDFWFDTIHNCTDVEEDNTDEHLDPPIIAVCTGLDKLTKPVNKVKKQYCQRYRDAIQDVQKRKHFRNICFVSNNEPSHADFNHVRDLIFECGKRLKSFGETLPLKWIRLEQSLDVLRESGFNIVSRYDVIDLSAKCDFNEQEREIQVEKFLKHQHKNGSIIYNSDIHDFVILSQQWLANAFKCLVSDKIDTNIQLSEEWEKLEKTGILEMSLITKLFKKEPELKFDKYQKHIIDVLNKFDIVGINYEEGRPLYYMPYMITSSYSPSLSVIFKTFGASNEECKQTPWLCLEFAFFPLAFFTHVMLYYVRNYTMCFDRELKKSSIYHGVGVFFLDDTQVNKLIVVFCKNTIAIQVWYWDPVAEDRYIEILSDIRKVIDSLKMRYEGHKLRYTVKVKCSDGDVNSQSGRISNRDLLDKSKDGKYFCNEHNRYHDSSQLFNTWFYKYSDDVSRAEESTDTESFDLARCQLCVSDPRPAVYWCTECVQAMCRECTTVHRTQPTSSTHSTVLLTHDYNFQINGINISDIASLCEGVLIISDYNGNQLITCDIRGQNKQFIPLKPYLPHRLSVIDQNNVAVTTLYPEKVLIVDVRQKNITKAIDIKKYCWGIMYRDNHLYVGCSDKSLVKVDMSGEIIRTVPLSFAPWYICSGTEGRIYCTDFNTVYCIDTEGNTVFPVNNPDMSDLSGITTDNEGHVLVVCRGSNNVHRISPDGKQCNVIIKDIHSSIDRYPRICYDSISKSIVIGRDDKVYIYKI